MKEIAYSFGCSCMRFSSGVATPSTIARFWHAWYAKHQQPGCEPRRLR